ncbi:maestro heat-like repeat-containing protein family member 2B [Spheniscus humboldti]
MAVLTDACSSYLMPKGDRVETYRELESVLQGGDGCLTSGVVNRLIAEASSDMRAAQPVALFQGVTDDVKTAASDVLVALARSHFHFVMSELQSHLKVMGKVPDETVLLTLGKMARSYALWCIPFVGMTLLTLRTMLSRVGSGRILRAVCSVLEQWSKGVNTYFCKREQCPFPRNGQAQLCEDIYPVFRYVVVNWLGCEEEEDKQAVLGAVAAMMGVLLHAEQHREHAWEQLLWLLQQYQEVRDTSRVTKSLIYVLETLEGVQMPIPQGTALAISTAAHRQLSDVTNEPGPAHKAVLSRCIVLQARICPEETVMFLHSQLNGGSEAGRVAALGLLGALAHSDAPATREKLPQVVEAVQSVCNDPSAPVRKAVLEFIRELLSSGSQSCWAWDVVGHIFNEFIRSSGRLVAGGLFAWETPEEGALQALCVDILGSLDVSLRGMTKLLWPRLLQYVVPAQYSGMLIPLSRCLQALAERRERAGCAEEEEEPDAVDSQEQARLPTPQALLARLLVVAAAPHESGERAVAALQLLQALHGRIHRALGAVWATEIPLLLQHLEGKTEISLASAEWEHCLLKFLRASLEPIEDKAWTVGLSQELSQQLGSSAPASWEKLFLYKALGTALAACQDLRHVQGQVLRFLQETNPVELSEAQGMIFVVSHAAKSHFHLVLDTVTMFTAAFTRDWFYQTSMGWKPNTSTPAAAKPWQLYLDKPSCKSYLRPVFQRGCPGIGAPEVSLERMGFDTSWIRAGRLGQLQQLLACSHVARDLTSAGAGNKGVGMVQRQQNTERAQATCTALMRTYSGIALRAPKEQLLTRVDKEIMGNILRLSRVKQRDLQLKLALVQSVTEVSSAILAVGDCGSFELSLKQEATRTLLDWIKGEPWDSLVYGVFQALEELSKLRPPLSREENHNLLSVCCQSVLSGPSKERMNKLLHRRGMEDLGHLMETLLEAEATSACFDDVVHVLKGWLTSAKEWERERALRVCAHVLGACKERFELMRGRPCKQFGSLVGLLGTLTSNCLATSCQRAWVCLGYLLQMQAKTMKAVPQADEIRCLCEEPNSPDTKTLANSCAAIAKAVCKCIPPAQATDFLTALLDSFLRVRPTCVKAVWKWVFIFLVECRKEILQEGRQQLTQPRLTPQCGCLPLTEVIHSDSNHGLQPTGSHPAELKLTQLSGGCCYSQGRASLCRPCRARGRSGQREHHNHGLRGHPLLLPQAQSRAHSCSDSWAQAHAVTEALRVPKILNTLYSSMQQSTHRPFSLHAVFLLTRFHREPVISSLLQKGLPMDSDTVELWRSLGRSTFGIQVLRCLAEKLNRAGGNRLGCERHNRQTALETLTIARAISEVVLALRSTEELKQLLPHLLPSLLRWVSETLGKERLLSPVSSWRRLFLEGRVLEEKPCRLFLLAVEMVLGKCMADKWMRLLMNRAVWARLEDPLAHPEGVCLLTSVLLQAGLVSPSLVQSLLPWLDSCSVNLQVTARAFFAEPNLKLSVQTKCSRRHQERLPEDDCHLRGVEAIASSVSERRS